MHPDLGIGTSNCMPIQLSRQGWSAKERPNERRGKVSNGVGTCSGLTLSRHSVAVGNRANPILWHSSSSTHQHAAYRLVDRPDPYHL